MRHTDSKTETAKKKENNEYQDMKILVTGIQGSGKTYFSRWLINNKFNPKRVLVYRVTPDWDKEKVIGYMPRRPVEEFETFGKNVKKMALQNKIDCVVIDEADMFFQHNFSIRERWNDLILMHRHYNLTLIFITRRPQDIPTKVVEQCHDIFIFSLEGANAKKKFREIDPQIEVLIDHLKYKQYNFIHKKIGEPPTIHKAIT